MSTPLRGLRFINTREAASAAALSRPLAALGAEVLECPLLAFVPPPSWQAFAARLDRLRPGDWVVFSSATAVRFTLERLAEQGGASRLAGARFAAVGKATAAALERAGWPGALVPPVFEAEALLDMLLARLSPAARVWLPRAEQGRELLAEGLRKAGMTVDVTPVYRTVCPKGAGENLRQLLKTRKPHWLLFTSASTVTHFFQELHPQGAARGCAATLAGMHIACLGRVTAETTRRHGCEVHIQPQQQDLEGLVAALVEHVRTASVGMP